MSPWIKSSSVTPSRHTLRGHPEKARPPRQQTLSKRGTKLQAGGASAQAPPFAPHRRPPSPRPRAALHNLCAPGSDHCSTSAWLPASTAGAWWLVCHLGLHTPRLQANERGSMSKSFGSSHIHSATEQRQISFLV